MGVTDINRHPLVRMGSQVVRSTDHLHDLVSEMAEIHKCPQREVIIAALWHFSGVDTSEREFEIDQVRKYPRGENEV